MEPGSKMSNKLLGSVLGEATARPGSAPPQVENELGINGQGNSGSLFGMPVTSPLLAPKLEDTASPEYIRYYYANRNLNPRLTPPTVGGPRDLTSPWTGATAAKPLDTDGHGQVLKLQDTADAQAALNLLLGTQLNIQDGPATTTSSIPIQPLLAPSAGDQFVGSWSARSGTATEQLGALLQAYNSPKALSPLLSGDVTGSGPTGTSTAMPSRFAVQAESSASALGLHDSIFAGGSGASTPRGPGPSNQLFDATVGSPCHSRTGSISGSVTGLSGAPLGSQDPKVNLRMSNGSLGDLGSRGQRKHEPSKLRNSSNHPGEFDPSMELLGMVPDSATASAQASAFSDALGGIPQGLLPSMLPGMSAEQQAAAAMAGMTPDGMAALLASNQAAAAGMPNQLHAMYMAAIYPFYAQQAMQAAAVGSYPGFMGMPQMMPYPGFPMMPPGLGDVRPSGFPVMGPGGFTSPMGGIPGFSPMPGMVPPDFASYYHKMMEAQASVMAAAAAGGGGGGRPKDDGDGDGLDGLHRHLHGLGADVLHPGSPLRGRGNRLSDERRDHSVERLGRGRAGDRRDSPSHRRDRDGPGSAPGSARKGRREDDRRVDAVLEEFKNNKSKRFEFKDIFGHIFEFSLDQHGSRFIQQKLEMVGLEELSMAFEEVQPRILALMTDVFGNYVVQKFLDHGSEEHRLKLASHLKGNVLSLSLQMYGCRVIQKALEVLPEANQVEIVAELDGQVMRCVRDQNGNHVIQKIIECVPTGRILHLIDSFLTCVVALSSHPFGCRVIQRILEHCQDPQRRAVVMEEILKSTCQLAQDQYGNYVIQHVLEHGSPQERMQVVTQLAPDIVPMSMHKFASNVVEKCLTFCSVAERDVLIHSMLGNHDHGDEEDPLQQMMKDQFGNYVVQKVLEVCDDSQRDRLLSRVRLQLHALKKYTYGKHIVARVEKLLAAGTKLQSSKLNGSRPLPDDSELQALQLMQQLQHLQAANAAAAAAGAGASGTERSSAPAGNAAAVDLEVPLPGRSSMPDVGADPVVSPAGGLPGRLVGSDTGDAPAVAAVATE